MAEHKQTELIRNAFTSARRKELETFQRALDMEWLDSRMADGKMGRCLAQIKTEAQMEKDYQERTDHAAQVNARAAKEIALAKEIASIRDKEHCELYRRQYLRENDPELREMIKKLEAGYLCRDLKMQILSNEYRRLQEKTEEKRKCDNLQKAYELYENQKRDSQENDVSRKLKYRENLQQQLVMKQQLRQCQYEESLREKMLLDDVIKAMYDEDMREIEQKKQLRETLRKEMVENRIAREIWMKQQRDNVIAEEIAREKDAASMSDRQTGILLARQKKNEQREELNEKVSSKIIAEQTARREREDIIKQLQEQELLEKYCQDDIREKEKELIHRRETERALKEQMENRKIEAENERKSDLKYKQLLESKVKEADDKERLKQEKIKERNRRYGEELKQQILNNAHQRDVHKQMEDRCNQNVWNSVRAIQEETAKERQLILSEHLPQLQESLCVPFINTSSLSAVGSDRPNSHPKCNAQCRVLRQF